MSHERPDTQTPSRSRRGGAVGSARAADGDARTAQNPPFYRTRLGSIEITVVGDGTIGFPPAMIFPDVPEPELEDFLAARYQPLDTTCRSSSTPWSRNWAGGGC
jgi:hypothetical protein